MIRTHSLIIFSTNLNIQNDLSRPLDLVLANLAIYPLCNKCIMEYYAANKKTTTKTKDKDNEIYIQKTNADLVSANLARCPLFAMSAYPAPPLMSTLVRLQCILDTSRILCQVHRSTIVLLLYSWIATMILEYSKHKMYCVKVYRMENPGKKVLSVHSSIREDP